MTSRTLLHAFTLNPQDSPVGPIGPTGWNAFLKMEPRPKIPFFARKLPNLPVKFKLKLADMPIEPDDSTGWYTFLLEDT